VNVDEQQQVVTQQSVCSWTLSRHLSFVVLWPSEMTVATVIGAVCSWTRGAHPAAWPINFLTSSSGFTWQKNYYWNTVKDLQNICNAIELRHWGCVLK